MIDFSEGDNEVVREEFRKITLKDININPDCRTPEENEYWEKRKVLVRTIVDYISGMTDNYAMNEYEKIYL